MSAIIIFCTVFGVFFGLISFIIIAVLYGAALAVPLGVGSGAFFTLALSVCMIINEKYTGRFYANYRDKNISSPVIYEDSLLRLNGDKNNAGRLFLTKDTLTAVILKKNTVLTEIKIPLDSISSIQKYYSRINISNIIIYQKDGFPTSFTSNNKKLCEHLSLLLNYEVFEDCETRDRKFSDEMAARLQQYTKQIESPSEAFQLFLKDYFTGNPMIRGRGEEDQTVWAKLDGKEREVAVQMILDNFGHDSAYIRAAGLFKDVRALPMLKNLIEELPETHNYEKLLAARVLYDWKNDEDYLSVLSQILPDSSDYIKINLKMWVDGLDRETAVHYIFMMLYDKSSFVRWCAYGTLLYYIKLGNQQYDDTKYYTSNDVYADSELFKKRIQELRDKIDSLYQTAIKSNPRSNFCRRYF